MGSDPPLFSEKVKFPSWMFGIQEVKWIHEWNHVELEDFFWNIFDSRFGFFNKIEGYLDFLFFLVSIFIGSIFKEIYSFHVIWICWYEVIYFLILLNVCKNSGDIYFFHFWNWICVLSLFYFLTRSLSVFMVILKTQLLLIFSNLCVFCFIDFCSLLFSFF